METFYYVIAIVLIFGAVILFHEAGHFFCAKLAKIRIYEFAMGMGPVLASFRRNDTQYSIRAIPIGGMVRVAGMEGEEEPVPDGFNSKSLPVRIAVIAAGPAMNVVLAALIFCLTYSIIGVPTGITPQVERVFAGSPAAKAGLRSGDRIVEINRVSKNLDAMREQIMQNPNKPIPMVVQRNGQPVQLQLVPNRIKDQQAEFNKDGSLNRVKEVRRGQIGITFKMNYRQLSVGAALVRGVEETVAITKGIVMSFVWLFERRVPAQFAGPVGIIGMMYDQAKISWLSFLQFAGIFNVMVAFFNLIPFPALDGSRIFFLLIEAVRGKPIDQRKENLVHTVGMVILLAFVLFVTVGDIWRRWGPQ